MMQNVGALSVGRLLAMWNQNGCLNFMNGSESTSSPAPQSPMLRSLAWHRAACSVRYSVFLNKCVLRIRIRFCAGNWILNDMVSALVGMSVQCWFSISHVPCPPWSRSWQTFPIAHSICLLSGILPQLCEPLVNKNKKMPRFHRSYVSFLGLP